MNFFKHLSIQKKLMLSMGACLVFTLLFACGLSTWVTAGGIAELYSMVLADDYPDTWTFAVDGLIAVRTLLRYRRPERCAPWPSSRRTGATPCCSMRSNCRPRTFPSSSIQARACRRLGQIDSMKAWSPCV